MGFPRDPCELDSSLLASLESSAAGYGIVEERFVEEQGAFVHIVVMVEVMAVRHFETLRRALPLVQLLYDVRCVRTALASVRVGRQTKLRGHRDDNSQLT